MQSEGSQAAGPAGRPYALKIRWAEGGGIPSDGFTPLALPAPLFHNTPFHKQYFESAVLQIRVILKNRSAVGLSGVKESWHPDFEVPPSGVWREESAVY